MLRDFLQDLRFSFRFFTRQPLYAGAAVGSLALGIGACTVIFSVVYALLLKPLPYARPEQLVHVGTTNPSLGGEDFGGIAPTTVMNILARPNTGFSALGGMTYDYANLTGVPTPTQLTVGEVTDGYLGTLGVAPAHGRIFVSADHRPGNPLTVVLGNPLWHEQFRADPDLVGQTIRIDDKPRVVVGIMPASFKEPNNSAELWLPIPMDDPMMSSETNRSLIGVGRLTDDSPATLAKVRAVLATVSANLAAAHPVENKGWHLEARELRAAMSNDAQRRGLRLLLGAVGCVLLVTCANVANLGLVRASARRREFGMRLALGASQGRIIRQCLVESALLAGCGGGLGMLLAAWGVDAVRGLLPAGYSPRQEEIALNLPVLGFAFALAALSGVASGLLPAWFASRQDPAGALAVGGGRAAAGGAGDSRSRTVLVVAEIGLALVLLAGAGLLGRSFLSLLSTSPGLRTERVLTLGLSLSGSRYPDAAHNAEFYRLALEKVRAVPGVENVGLTSTQFFNWTLPFSFIKPGQSPDDPTVATQNAAYDAVNPECFAALDIPLRRGRVFDARDTLTAPPVVIVNEQFARRFYPGGNALGQTVTSGRRKPVTMQIVGIVGDVRRNGADAPAPAQAYVPCLQAPMSFSTLFVRAAGSLPAEDLTRPVQTAVWSIDPDLPITNVSTLEHARRQSVGPARLYLALFGLFAGLTLGLAALGVYGTVSYGVGQRTREIGIRLALGAQRRDVLRLVLGQGTRMILFGLALGLMATLALARLLASLLYGVTANDPVTLFVVAALLGAVALLASYLPARRATRIDPLTALREE